MFANYEALKAAIISWADNEDVTPRVDDFIALAHTRLNRKLRLEEMSELAFISTEIDNPWVPKPPGYLGMRRAKLNDNPTDALTYWPFSRIDCDVAANRPGMPSVYSVAADRIRLGPIPNAVWEIEVLYYVKQSVLSPTVDTNVFLEQASDLLLYGALIEAEPFLKDHEGLATWKDLYVAGLADIADNTESERFPDGDLAVVAV